MRLEATHGSTIWSPSCSVLRQRLAAHAVGSVDVRAIFLVLLVLLIIALLYVLLPMLLAL